MPTAVPSAMLGDMYSSFHFILPDIQQGGIFPILEIKLISGERGQGICPRTQKLRANLEFKPGLPVFETHGPFPVVLCQRSGTRTRIPVVWLDSECPGFSALWSQCCRAALLFKANLTHHFSQCPHHIYFKYKKIRIFTSLLPL